MKRRVYFYPQPGYSELPEFSYGHHACNTSVTSLLAEYYDCSGKPVPSVGYRLTESKHDQATATFDHQGGITHTRTSAWRVIRVEEFVANTGLESVDEIVLAFCEYTPLPDSENPWVETEPAIVSPDSFGGDTAAYEAWRQQTVGV